MKVSGSALALTLTLAAWVAPGCVEDTTQPEVRQGDPTDMALLESLSFKRVPDFLLNDRNTNSPTYQEDVSPRELAGRVSSYYFGSAT